MDEGRECYQRHGKGGLISESFSLWLKSPKKCAKNYTVKKIGDGLKEVKTNLRFFGLS